MKPVMPVVPVVPVVPEPDSCRGAPSTTGDHTNDSRGAGESELLHRSETGWPPASLRPVPYHEHRSTGQTWPRPLLVALALSAGVVLADALLPVLPGVPGAPTGLVGHLFALLSGICPQRSSHSYTLGGVQLPLKARMLGMFGGFAAGVLELATVGRARSHRWPHVSAALARGLGFTAMAVDGVNALLFDLADLGLPHLYTPDLRLRLGTGLLAGVALAFALVPALGQLDAADPGLTTRDGPDQPSGASPPSHPSHASHPSRPSRRPGLRDVGWTLLAGGALALLTASGWGVLLDPLALVAAGGGVLALGLVNRTALGALLAAGRGRQLGEQEWVRGIVALTLAVAELVLLALLRATFLLR